MAFLTDILTGIVLGCGYDLLKAIRNTGKKTLISIVCDLVFWLFSCCLILWVFFLTSAMELRAYEFFGLMTGFFLYFSLLSRLLAPVYKKIAEILQLFCRILFTSLRLSVIMMKNGVLFFCRPFLWGRKLIKKLFRIPLRAWRENLKQIKRI